MSMNLDIEFVRNQFPALAGEWTFFDNAGGSQTLRQVADRVHEYLLNSNVQLGATYDISSLSTGRVDDGQKAMAAFVNAPESCEAILGSSTSMLLKNLSHSLGEIFRPGDEVIVTNCDHEANIGPWYNLERKGITVNEWTLNRDTLELELDDLKGLITHKTRLVALTHASNILGTINDIKNIAAFVHKMGALICVDGVAYAPHRPVDVRELDVDFYSLSFYKIYGPHYSMLYARKKYLETMPGINHFFLEQDIPYKMQPGNVNYELTYGLLGLVDYFTSLAEKHGHKKENFHDAVSFVFSKIAAHEEQLAAKMLDFLDSKKNVRILGKSSHDRSTRVPTISFTVDRIKSNHITQQVDKHKIGIRYGDFYARRLIEYLGLVEQNGVIRVSMVHYNTIDEVERLIKILDPLI